MNKLDLSVGDIITYTWDVTEMDEYGNQIEVDYTIVGLVIKTYDLAEDKVKVQDIKVLKGWNDNEEFICDISDIYTDTIQEKLGTVFTIVAEKYPEYVI